MLTEIARGTGVERNREAGTLAALKAVAPSWPLKAAGSRPRLRPSGMSPNSWAPIRTANAQSGGWLPSRCCAATARDRPDRGSIGVAIGHHKNASPPTCITQLTHSTGPSRLTQLWPAHGPNPHSERAGTA
jgi:hypothetical protein